MYRCVGPCIGPRTGRILVRVSVRDSVYQSVYRSVSAGVTMRTLSSAGDSLPRVPEPPTHPPNNRSTKRRRSTPTKNPKKNKNRRPVRSVSCTTCEEARRPNITLTSATIKLPNIGDRAPSREATYVRRTVSAVPRASRAEDDPSPATGRRPRRVSLLVAVKPDNVETEREKFFKSNFQYNPQFVYKYSVDPGVRERMGRPSAQLLHIAERMMRSALARHGSYDRFEEMSGGKTLNRVEILEAARRYLRQEKLETEVQVRLSEDLIARACMSRINGKPTLQVRSTSIREHWIRGLLNHEIGTHYLRGANNRQHAWSNAKKRRALGLRPVNPTEEGLASLHSVIFRPLPLLWKSALLYYVSYQAAHLSFVELFKDVGQFVQSAAIRWEYCLRAKRGQTDTSQPGTFCKDQVYLKGALDILKNRHDIDFHMLVRCGKVDHRDVPRLAEQAAAAADNTRIPAFMVDLTAYRTALDHIVTSNGLSDRDLDEL